MSREKFSDFAAVLPENAKVFVLNHSSIGSRHSGSAPEDFQNNFEWGDFFHSNVYREWGKSGFSGGRVQYDFTVVGDNTHFKEVSGVDHGDLHFNNGCFMSAHSAKDYSKAELGAGVARMEQAYIKVRSQFDAPDPDFIFADQRVSKITGRSIRDVYLAVDLTKKELVLSGNIPIDALGFIEVSVTDDEVIIGAGSTPIVSSADWAARMCDAITYGVQAGYKKPLPGFAMAFFGNGDANNMIESLRSGGNEILRVPSESARPILDGIATIDDKFCGSEQFVLVFNAGAKEADDVFSFAQQREVEKELYCAVLDIAKNEGFRVLAVPEVDAQPLLRQIASEKANEAGLERD